MEMRRSTTTTTTTTMLPILLCNVLPNPKTLSRGWSGGPASRGKGMDGLGQSPFTAVDLLSRVWIDNSMRHQNGRSRAAVASSLLRRLVSWSLLTLPLLHRTRQSCSFMPSCSFSSPIRSVRNIMYVYPCLDLHR